MQQQQQQQTQQQQQQQQLHEKHQLGQGADEQKDQFSSGPRHGQQQRLCKDVQELLDASYHQKNMQELQHGQEGQKQLVGLPFHGGQGQKEKHGSSTEPALSLESDNIKQPDDEHLPEQEHSGEARIALLRSAAERALPPEVAQRRPADQRCTAARLLSPEPLPNTTTTPTTTTARIKTTTPPTLRVRKRRTREAAATQCMQSYLQAGEAAAAAAAAAVPSQAVALQKLQKDNITAAIVEALEVRPWTPCLEDQDLQPSMRVHAPTSVPLFRARSAPAITREPSYISVRAAARPVRPTLPALPALPMPGPADTTALGEMSCPQSFAHPLGSSLLAASRERAKGRHRTEILPNTGHFSKALIASQIPETPEAMAEEDETKKKRTFRKYSYRGARRGAFDERLVQVLVSGVSAVNMSKDHVPSLPEERRRVLKAGGFINKEGRINGNLNLSRALGDLFYKKNKKLGPEGQLISGVPELRHRNLVASDRYLVIGCDGIWERYTSQMVVDFLLKRLDPLKGGCKTFSSASADFLDTNLSKNPNRTQGLGCDNMSLMIVDLGSLGGAGKPVTMPLGSTVAASTAATTASLVASGAAAAK
ncbi:unnamed protein product, partial [Polarella glacialis]